MTRFFRLSDKGTITKPTPQAILTTLAWVLVSTLIFYNKPVIALLCWVFGYATIAVILSKPFRVAMCKLMYFTRYPSIVSIISKKDDDWREANEVILKGAGLRIFEGAPQHVDRKGKKA